MDPSALKPVTDLVDFDPVEKYVIYGPMAIWKWVVRRMNSDKPVILFALCLQFVSLTHICFSADPNQRCKGFTPRSRSLVL